MSASAAIAALKDIRRTLDRMAEIPRATAREASSEITSLLQQQFSAGTDPYGQRWVPLRPRTLRKHGPPPLTYTAVLRSGTRAIVMGSTLQLRAGAPYGAFHQVGFRVHGRPVPARKIFPSRGLPTSWKRAFVAAAQRAAQKLRSR